MRALQAVAAIVGLICSILSMSVAVYLGSVGMGAVFAVAAAANLAFLVDAVRSKA